MRKSVVVAGNGPSLAQIDYRRLPKEFDVYRCNRFFKEDKYYLGNIVTTYWSAGPLTLDNLLEVTACAMEGYYNIHRIRGLYSKIITTIKKHYPQYCRDLVSREFYVEELDDFMESYRRYYHYAHKNRNHNVGTRIFMAAIQSGYTEIYVTGIELPSSENWSWNYAYTDELCKPNKEGFYGIHDPDFDRAIFEFAKSLPGINIYSIVEGSTLSTIFPLAPVQNDAPYIPKEKIADPMALKRIEQYMQREKLIFDKLRDGKLKWYTKQILGLIYHILKKTYRLFRR